MHAVTAFAVDACVVFHDHGALCVNAAHWVNTSKGMMQSGIAHIFVFV